MIRRTRRRSTTTTDSYLRYLKPGALAKLRDSKINAKSHHRSTDSQIYLHRTASTSPLSTSSSPSRSPIIAAASAFSGQQFEATVADSASPCFSGRFYGPRCPQRKKLMAARSMFFLDPNATGITSDGPEPVIDAFSNDLLIAH